MLGYRPLARRARRGRSGADHGRSSSPDQPLARVLARRLLQGLDRFALALRKVLRHGQLYAREPFAMSQGLSLGVEARVPGGALRADEALLLVHAQRLRVHSDELGRN